MQTTELFTVYKITNGYLVSTNKSESGQYDAFYEDLEGVLREVAQLAGTSADAAVALYTAYKDQRDQAFAELSVLDGVDRPLGEDTEVEEDSAYDN